MSTTAEIRVRRDTLGLAGALRSRFPRLMRWQSSRRALWRSYWLTGEWELRELHKHITKPSLTIDVGGNIGEYSYHLARMSRKVMTFEPNPYYVGRIESLDIRNVEIHQVALSDRAGEAQLRIPRVGAGVEDAGMASLERRAVSDDHLSRTLEVPRRTLDSYGLKAVSFIKIDVEGHEERVLDGAMATIASNRPTVLVEIEERHNSGALGRVSDRLRTLGYDGFFFDKGRRTPLSRFDSARMQDPSVLDGVKPHNRRAVPYINNFLFVPTSA